MLVRMMKGIPMSIAVLLVGCGSVKSSPGADAAADTAGGDAASPACDVAKPFAAAVEVPGLHDAAFDDVHATLTDDERTVYFASNRIDRSTAMHIYTATRASRDRGFDMPMLLGATFSDQGESHPSISPDGNTIYFDSFRVTAGTVHIFTATRSNAGVEFPTPSMIKGDFVISPAITDDGNALYVSNLANGRLSRMPRTGSTFGDMETVAVPSNLSITAPVTRDELTMYLSIGDATGHEIVVSQRSSTSAAWSMPMTVTELKTGASLAEPSWISRDGCRLYLTYAEPNGRSIIYMASRPM